MKKILLSVLVVMVIPFLLNGCAPLVAGLAGGALYKEYKGGDFNLGLGGDSATAIIKIDGKCYTEVEYPDGKKWVEVPCK